MAFIYQTQIDFRETFVQFGFNFVFLSTEMPTTPLQTSQSIDTVKISTTNEMITSVSLIDSTTFDEEQSTTMQPFV